MNVALVIVYFVSNFVAGLMCGAFTHDRPIWQGLLLVAASWAVLTAIFIPAIFA
jgi:hypothetical protein